MIKKIYLYLCLVVSFGSLLLAQQAALYQTKIERLGATIPVTVAVFETSLQASISSSATSMTLNNGADDSGDNLSGYICFVIDEGTSSEEFVCGTASGTAISSMVRGIDPVDGDLEVTALQKAHRRGASVKITNHPQLAILSRILNGDETLPNIISYNSHPTFTADEDVIDKKYADDLAIAGAPDGTTTVKGLFEEATQAEIEAGTAAGGTSARLCINPSSLATSIYNTQLPGSDEKGALAGTSGTPSSSNKYVTSDDVSTSATANKIPRLDASGLLAAESTRNASVLTAGETIAAGQVVYQNKSDNEVYLADGNDTSKMKFAGFALDASTDGNSIIIQGSGIVRGVLSGLAEGEKYYVQDTAGTIGTSPGSSEVLIGIALSETALLVQKGGRYASGATSFNSTTDQTITVGFRVSKVRIFAVEYEDIGDDTYTTSSGGWTVQGGNDCVRIIAYQVSGTGSTTSATNAWSMTQQNGVVDNITDTTFDLNVTYTSGTTHIFWEAYGEF